MTVGRSLMRSVDERGNDSMDQSPPRDFSNTVRQPSLPAWSKAPGCPFSLLWPRSPVTATNPVWRVCDFLSHTRSHTHIHTPTPVHTHRSERSASHQHVIQLLCHVILCIYTLNSISAAHTHTLSTWDILCSSCALLQQCACVGGWRLLLSRSSEAQLELAVMGFSSSMSRGAGWSLRLP